MVRGLDIFQERFAAYVDQYVLIGGTAATLAMEEGGLEFRATKDLDIVLHVEASNGRARRGESFGQHFLVQRLSELKFPAVYPLLDLDAKDVGERAGRRLGPCFDHTSGARESSWLFEDCTVSKLINSRPDDIRGFVFDNGPEARR